MTFLIFLFDKFIIPFNKKTLDCLDFSLTNIDSSRQVKKKFIHWGLDKEAPRSIIRVRNCAVDEIPDYLKYDTTITTN